MSISLDEGREIFSRARKELHKLFVGYDDLITCIFLCIISIGLNTTGHMLIIGKTGTGKSRISGLIAPMFGLGYHRMDGNGEPLPSDILGYQDPRTDEIIRGPIFTNIFHADELNRFSPRTRAALLAPMAERLVTIQNDTLILDSPFVVIATENPASYGDAAPLRLQERDRFSLSFFSDWPDEDEQIEIARINTDFTSLNSKLPEICARDQILDLQNEIAGRLYIDSSIRQFGIRAVRQLAPDFSDIESVKNREDIRDTSIVRGGNDLLTHARSFAFLQGDDFVTPEHIRWVAEFALPHRMDAQDFSRHERKEVVRMALNRANEKMYNGAR
ncbi:MAG: MoxR family ATPase [Candidatus Spechtbacterales bacterium]